MRPINLIDNNFQLDVLRKKRSKLKIIVWPDKWTLIINPETCFSLNCVQTVYVLDLYVQPLQLGKLYGSTCLKAIDDDEWTCFISKMTAATKLRLASISMMMKVLLLNVSRNYVRCTRQRDTRKKCLYILWSMGYLRINGF